MLVLATLVAAIAAPVPSTLQADVQSLVDVQAREAAAPAVVVGIVDGDNVSYVAHGVTRIADGSPVDEASTFQIASLSKLVTGIIASRMVAEGTLDPDAPVAVFVPESVRDAVAGMTVAHLIHHRSGLARDTAWVERVDGEPMVGGLTREGLWSDLVTVERVGAPGERYAYSNLGYALLGHVLETVSALSYAELVQRYVTDPFGLPELSNAEPEKGAVTPYAKDDPLRETSAWETGLLMPASGLWADTRSLAIIAQAILAAYRDGDAADPLRLTRHHGDVADGRVYGYGFNCQPLALGGKDRTLCYHSGDLDGFAGVIMIVPEANRGFVLLTSRGGAWKDRLQVAILKRLLAD